MTEYAPRPETDDASETAAHADREAGTGHLIQVAIDAAIKETLADLRERLVKHQAELMDLKVAAYEAGDTLREAHLDGQITGIAVAMGIMRDA